MLVSINSYKNIITKMLAISRFYLNKRTINKRYFKLTDASKILDTGVGILGDISDKTMNSSVDKTIDTYIKIQKLAEERGLKNVSINVSVTLGPITINLYEKSVSETVETTTQIKE